MARLLPLLVPEGSTVHTGLRVARVAVALIAAYALPYLVASHDLGQITGALILAVAVVGLNVLSGFGGQISLGHAAFFGLGAYTSGILITTYQLAPPLAFLAGVLLCFAVGVLVGIPALRLQGTYLAVVTLAVGVIFPSLVRRFDGLTGGGAGLFGIEYPAPEMSWFPGRAGQALWIYYVAVVALLVSCLIAWNIMRGRVGRAIVALRDNESAAVVMGPGRQAAKGLSGSKPGFVA